MYFNCQETKKNKKQKQKQKQMTTENNTTTTRLHALYHMEEETVIHLVR